MVSKMAITAIVIIVAAPILIGYAMAFEDVERTRYNPADTKNVTDLILNDTTYSYMSANSYALNSKVWNTSSSYPQYNEYPEYREISATHTSLPMGYSDSLPATFVPSDYKYIMINLTDDISASSHTVMTVHGGNNDGMSYSYFKKLTYYADQGIQLHNPEVYMYNYTTDTLSTLDVRSATSLSFDLSTYTGGIQVHYIRADGSTDNTYANTTSGYNVYRQGLSTVLVNEFATWVPGLDSSNILATVDLRDLTGGLGGDSKVAYRIIAIGDNKRVSVLEISRSSALSPWTINGTEMFRSDDPDKNVWQFMITNGNIDAAYVGSWPNTLGPAYAYQTISVPFESLSPGSDIQAIYFNKESPTDTERMRIDAATTRSAPYPVIRDQTYSPALLNNAADGYVTEFSKVGQYGSSIDFAGNSYAVSNGRITVGSKTLPLEGLTFRSEKDDDGNFTNYIGDIKLATTTASLPILTLVGTWGMIVQTTYLDKEIVTVTEWIPGEFAWNGTDQSFALIGLATCVAVFVGLGMYGRRSGAKVGMLMLITGCAAFIFLAMI